MEKLQLVAVTCLFIASKFEEIQTHLVKHYAKQTDRAATKQDILEAESIILQTLNFELGTPTAIHFVRRFSRAADHSSRDHCVSKYILELSLYYYHMLKYDPSTQAAAAVYLTRRLHRHTPYWVSLCSPTRSEKRVRESMRRSLNWS